MLLAFFHVIYRELLIAFRRKSDVVNPLCFFILVITLFPLALGPAPQLIARFSPAIIWVAALLSSLLSLERLFRDDFSDGSLEQLLLTPYPLGLLVTAKVVAHWLLTGMPILMISPVLALLLSLDMQTYLVTLLTLILGTPILSFIGAIGAALTVGLRKGGVLLSLLMLPLYLPVLIFATSAIDAAAMALPCIGLLQMLAAFLLAAMVLTPFAIAASLRISLH